MRISLNLCLQSLNFIGVCDFVKICVEPPARQTEPIENRNLPPTRQPGRQGQLANMIMSPTLQSSTATISHLTALTAP